MPSDNTFVILAEDFVELAIHLSQGYPITTLIAICSIALVAICIVAPENNDKHSSDADC